MGVNRIGKALSSYLKALIEDAESQSVGVIVGFQRKLEIEAIVNAAGLPKDRFAVLTSDEYYNDLGSDTPDTAQVLFTTQERLKRLFVREQRQEFEPHRDCRRLKLLRGLSNDKQNNEQVFR